MKKGNWFLMAIVPLLFLGTVRCTYYTNPGETDSGGGEIPLPDLEYIGSDKCQLCHQDIHESFMKTGHPFILSKVEDGVAPEYPFTSLDFLPSYYTNEWLDLSYVIIIMQD